MRRLLNWRTIAGIVAPGPCSAASFILLYLLSRDTSAREECNDRVMRFLYLTEQLPQSQVHKRWNIIGVYCKVMRARAFFFYRSEIWQETSVAVKKACLRLCLFAAKARPTHTQAKLLLFVLRI